jgi:hypothetical protein
MCRASATDLYRRSPGCDRWSRHVHFEPTPERPPRGRPLDPARRRAGPARPPRQTRRPAPAGRHVCAPKGAARRAALPFPWHWKDDARLRRRIPRAATAPGDLPVNAAACAVPGELVRGDVSSAHPETGRRTDGGGRPC